MNNIGLKEIQIYTYLDYALDIAGLNQMVLEKRYQLLYKQYQRNCEKYQKQYKNSIFMSACHELNMFDHVACLLLALKDKPIIKKTQDNYLVAMFCALKMYEEPFEVYKNDLGYVYESKPKVDYDHYFCFRTEDFFAFSDAFLNFMNKPNQSFNDFIDTFDQMNLMDDLYNKVAKATATRQKNKVKEKSQ